MSRSSARRGQVEPLAAIGAVLIVGVGLTLYAGALDDAIPAEQEQPAPAPVLDEVERTVERNGVAIPTRLSESTAVAPDGTRLNVTLQVGGRHWQTGPRAPATARNASSRVSVRVEPGEIRPGSLTVRVW